MDKEKTLLSLNAQLDTLKAHINRLKKSNYKIHVLDVDMLKQKTIEFYDTVFELESRLFIKEEIVIEDVKVEEPVVTKTPIAKTITKKPVVEKPVVEKVVEEMPVVKEVVEEVPVTIKIPVVEKEPIIEDVIIKEPVIESKPIAKEEPVIEEVIVKTEPIPEVKKPEIEEEPTAITTEEEETNTATTTYDLFSGSADNALAEKFHINEEQSIADKMQRKQVVNIREAIGINEKFLFINELFNGDMGRYNKILDDINDLPTKQGVDTYIFEMKIQFQWADDNEAYLKLME